MADDALLFIDANIYLDLYKQSSESEILDQLAGLSNAVFCTRQVRDEVRRRKQEIALSALDEVFQQIAMKKIEKSLPKHLLSAHQHAELCGLLAPIQTLNQKLNECKRTLTEQIDLQQDAVSRALALIFQNSVPHSADDLERARERKDRGNLPGKGSGLGDQLNWEQILVRFQGKERLWIISNDSDYGVFTEGIGTLHGPLQDELRDINRTAEAYLFRDLGVGLEDFTKKISNSSR